MEFDIADFVEDKKKTINLVIDYFKEKQNLIEDDLYIGEEDIQETFDDETPALFFYIHYQNSKGQKSEKIIRLFKCYWERGDIYFRAKSLKENRVKTFIASRVLQLINPETGEIINDVPFYLQHHPLMDLTNKAELTEESKIVADYRDEIYLLSLMAAVDNEIHALEYDYIINFIANCADQILDEHNIKRHFCLLEPNEYAIKAALDRIKAIPERHSEFLRAIRNLMLADGVLHESEVGFCRYLIANINTV